MTNNYLQDLMIRMAHHSTAIEGNTLTQYETKAILLSNFVPRPVNLREVYEVSNYRNLIPYLLENEEPISLQTVKDIHAILLNQIDDRAGNFKTTQNMIVGADFIPSFPYLVQSDLKNWTDTLFYRLEHAVSDVDKVEAIMAQHLRFERIHPFPDGNGRTGRALIIYSCFQQKLTPIVIEREQRTAYMNCLNQQDVKGLCKLALTVQEKENIRKKVFDQDIDR